MTLFRRFSVLIILTIYGCKEANQLDILKTDIEQQIQAI